MSKPYVMHGWHLSFFAGKTRSYLNYKNIPFIDQPVSAYNLMYRIPKETGARVMPVVVTPEGQWLQDSKHIVDVLEQRFPEHPVTPAAPRQLIAALLIEAWADEFWIPLAMQYRWIYPENYALFEHDAGKALLPGFPKFLQKRMVAHVAKLLRGYLPAVGVVPEQYAVQERWTERMLDALDKHFAVHPYLFGSKPCLADFALNGPMYGHLSRDPYPKRVLIDPRPHLKAWVQRMNTQKAGGGEWLPNDTIPETLNPVFDAIFTEFYPMIEGYAAELRKLLPGFSGSRFPRSLGRVEFPMGDGRYGRTAMPYTLWMMQRITDRYRALDGKGRASVDAWLRERGAPAAMSFDAGVRLERTGLHVKRAA